MFSESTIGSPVRRAVPPDLPVSAKMRLGNRDASRMLDNARAIAAAGASELVVHGRTKVDGYRPPAYWDQIAHIREAVAIPVVSPARVKRCVASRKSTVERVL